MKSSRAVAIAITALLLGPLVLVQTAGADDAGTIGRLPQAVRAAAAVHDDNGLIYVIGGTSDTKMLDTVLVYDTMTGEVRDTGARLPSPRQYHSTIWDNNGSIYILGGVDGTGTLLDEIIRYVPAENRVERLDVRLPQPLAGAPAAWVGDSAYIFGGNTPNGKLSIIQRLDLTAGTIEPVPGATFATGRSHMLASVDAENSLVYVFGGRSSSCFLRDIHRFDPATGDLSATGALLPESGSGAPCGGRYDMAGGHVAEAGAIFLFGGYAGSYCPGAFPNDILRYNLTTNKVTVEGRMPSARSAAASTVAPGGVYVFGGRDCGTDHDQILRLNFLDPLSEPRNVEASQGLEEGSVVLTWEPPASGATPVRSYRLYRAEDAQPADLLRVIEGNATSYRDTKLPSGNYTYHVVAVGDQGASAPSENASATVVSTFPGIPENVQAQPGPLSGEITLTWAPPTDRGPTPIRSYAIYRSTTPGEERFYDLVDADERIYRDQYLKVDQYFYRVAAVTSSLRTGALSDHADAIATAPMVLGFGDSVAAAHGLNEHGATTGWPFNPDTAFPALVGSHLQGETFNFAISGACAMAATDPGAHPSTPESCDVSITQQLERFRQAKASIDALSAPSVMVVSVGADDIHFAKCFEAYMRNDNEHDPCREPTLTQSLTAFRVNLATVLSDVRKEVGPLTPIVLTKYYNPLPPPAITEDQICDAWAPAAAVRHPAAFAALTWESFRTTHVREVQSDAYRYAEGIITKLNAAIDTFEGDAILTAPVNFAGHDFCATERGEPVENAWVFGPELHLWVNRTARTPGAPPLEEHEYHPVGPLPNLCPNRVIDPPPERTNGRVDAGVFAIEYDVHVIVNCMPHPTVQGHEALADAVLDGLFDVDRTPPPARPA